MGVSFLLLRISDYHLVRHLDVRLLQQPRNAPVRERSRILLPKRVSRKQIPWRGILTNAPVWALLAVQIGCDWGTYTILPSNMKEILQYDQRQRFVIIVASRLHMGHRDLIRIFMQLANKQKETQRWISQEDIYHNRYNQTIEICPIDHFTSSAQIGPAVFIVCAAYSKCGDRGQ